MQVNSAARRCVYEPETHYETRRGDQVLSKSVTKPRDSCGAESSTRLPEEPETDFLDDAADAVGSFFSGLLESLGGLFKDLGDAVLSMFSTPVLDTLAVGSTNERMLTSSEREMAKRVFGDSIDYDKVRIGEGGKLLFSITQGREITLGNEIVSHEGKLNPHTFIHELTHVWQYQHGGGDYAPKALVAQLKGDAGVGPGYDWRKGIDAGESWKDLNPEQQAQLVADAYVDLYSDSPNAERIEKYGVAYAKALKELQVGHGAP
ncbi:MAG: hypothetical protein AB7K71_07125 [Polyangiaceae bacterium]